MVAATILYVVVVNWLNILENVLVHASLRFLVACGIIALSIECV